ncbi:GNAT family N-acetyltransferase [Flindersiella endophytica]
MPPADGTIRVVPQPVPEQAAVVVFTAHILIAADIEPEWAATLLPPGDLSEPLNPPFLGAVCERTKRRVNCVDMVTYAPALPGDPPLALERIDDDCACPAPAAPAGSARTGPPHSCHPRVRRAHVYRSDVSVWTLPDGGGVLILGRGLAGRWEAAFEVPPEHRGRGLGRLLAQSARHLLPAGTPGVWAQVSPGNAASVRTLLAGGFLPVGSEALLVRHRSPGG